MSVKIIQDVIMTLSGSSKWEKRKCFLSEEGGTYMEWTTYFRPLVRRGDLRENPFLQGFLRVKALPV